MKATRNILIGLLFGAAIGWFLGFLRLPGIEKFPSFIMGFIVCLLLLLLAFTLLIAWNKHTYLLRMLGKTASSKDSNTVTRTYSILWILVAVFIVGGGLLSSFLIYKQGRFFKTQLQNQNRKIRELSVLIESGRKGSQVILMSNLLKNVEEELKQNNTLSDAVIARIAALSFSFKPYKYLEGDSLSGKEYSPERGQLLMALLLMKIDTGSFTKIKQRTTFAGADLRGADLKNADLSYANLSGTNLKETDLGDANLKNADLNDAILWGANLNRANLSGADLKRSDLRWATLNETNLKFANLNGAQMSGAQLIMADIQQAFVQYADLGGTLFNDANLSGVNFLGAKMNKVNFNNADLTRADLRMSNLNEAILLGTELNKALVDSNWVEKLSDWRLTGSKEIQSSYHVISDSLDHWKHPVYHLRKIKK